MIMYVRMGFFDVVAVEKVRRAQNNHRGLVLRSLRNHEGEMLTAAPQHGPWVHTHMLAEKGYLSQGR